MKEALILIGLVAFVYGLVKLRIYENKRYYENLDKLERKK